MELHGNAMSHTEQIQEATPYEITVVRPLTSRIKNHLRWTRHAGHCWRSKDELISDVLLWTPTHRHASVGWPERTYLDHLCADTWCSLEDKPGSMDDKDGWKERVREIHAVSMTWWWWYIYIYTHTHILFHSIQSPAGLWPSINFV